MLLGQYVQWNDQIKDNGEVVEVSEQNNFRVGIIRAFHRQQTNWNSHKEDSEGTWKCIRWSYYLFNA